MNDIKTYEPPVAEVIYFDSADVMGDSLQDFNDPNIPGGNSGEPISGENNGE